MLNGENSLSKPCRNSTYRINELCPSRKVSVCSEGPVVPDRSICDTQVRMWRGQDRVCFSKGSYQELEHGLLPETQARKAREGAETQDKREEQYRGKEWGWRTGARMAVMKVKVTTGKQLLKLQSSRDGWRRNRTQGDMIQHPVNSENKRTTTSLGCSTGSWLGSWRGNEVQNGNSLFEES